MVVAGVATDRLERNTLIAGAVIQFSLFAFACLSRWWVHCVLGVKRVECHKAFFSYWKLFTFLTFVANMFILFTLWDNDRDVSHPLVNWSRWLFYTMAYGVGLVGMLAEFQMHRLHWTRYYVGTLVGAVALLMLSNAFAPHAAQQQMLFGFIAFFGVWAIYSVFHFDERFYCGWSRSLSVLVSLCLGTIAAMFIVGHANQQKISRAHEFIGYVVVDAILATFVALAALCVGPYVHAHYCAEDAQCAQSLVEVRQPPTAVILAGNTGIVGM